MKDRKLLALVTRASQKDQAAFETLCELKAKEIIFLCTRELGNVHDGQDAAQEVFLKMQRYITELQAPEAFNVWLNRIVVTTCSNMRRSNMRHKDALSIEDFGDAFVDEGFGGLPQEYAEDADKRRRLVELIDELPEKYRTPVLLHYYQHMSYDEIAAVLEVGRNTVDNNLRMARKILKLELENEYGATGQDKGVPLLPLSAVLGAALVQAADATVTPGIVAASLQAGGVYTAFTAAAGGAAAGFAADLALKVVAALAALTVTAGGICYAVSHSTPPADSPASAASQADIAVLPLGDGAISGTVVLENTALDPQAYNGLDGLTLELMLADYPDQVLLTTETSGGPGGGAFEFAGLGAGRFMVRARLPADATVLHDGGGTRVGEGGYWLRHNGGTVLALGGAGDIAGLHLTLDLPTPVSGRVMRADGTSYARAGITVELWDPQQRLIATTATDADGAYAFDSPMVSQHGDYTLTLSLPADSADAFVNGVFKVIELTPGVGHVVE